MKEKDSIKVKLRIHAICGNLKIYMIHMFSFSQIPIPLISGVTKSYFLQLWIDVIQCKHYFTAGTVLTQKLVFTELAPLGQFSHRVAMSVCLHHWVHFFVGLSFALRSHDLFLSFFQFITRNDHHCNLLI